MPVIVSGLREKVRQLEALGVDVEDLKDGFAAIAAEGANLASRLVKRDTGKLAGSIRGNRAKGKAVVTAGRASVPYAGGINYGWGRLHSNFKHGRHATGIRGAYRGSGFMQRADAALEDRAAALLEEGLNNAVTKRGLA